jgi:predicted AAA+ superfamily ATPase
MFPRLASFPEGRSFFLFGARGTGKTTLLRQRFKDQDTLWLDMLAPSMESRLSRRPELLEAMVMEDPGKVIILDEIQKVPALLDVVHSLLSRKIGTFILTGSSARKLKRGGANLLAGRAAVRELYPLCRAELGGDFSVDHTLNWGSLPEICGLAKDQDKLDFLLSYTHTYLKEEIAAEQLVRKVDLFRGFLEVAAQSNAKLVNASNIARDVGIDPKTVQTYISVLEDTHLGFMVEQYQHSARKRVMAMPRFYFFDTGVTRALAQTIYHPVALGTSYYGECFEHLVVAELFRLASYENRGRRLFTLTTQDGFELDLVLQTPGKALMLLEIKSSIQVDERHAKSLLLARKDFPPDTRCFLLSQDEIPREEQGIMYLPWYEFLDREFPTAIVPDTGG